MLTVRLHGHLEEKFGSEFRFEAKTVREVLDALQANFDNFTEEFIKDQRAYNILVDAEAQEINGCVVPIKTDSVIDIIPIVGGAGFLKSLGLIIIGALLITFAPQLAMGFVSSLGGGSFAAGFALGSSSALFAASGAATLATAISAIGWGLALAGVASLLAGPDGPDGGGPKSSSLSSAENVIGQGISVPIGYGRMLVGTFVLSATYTSSNIKKCDAFTFRDPTTKMQEDTILVHRGPSISLDQYRTVPEGEDPPSPITVYGGITEEARAEVVNEWSRLIQAAGPFYEIVTYSNQATGQTIPATRFDIGVIEYVPSTVP